MTNRVDAHAHCFVQGLALADGRRYAPSYDAPIADYLSMLAGNGMTHGVLVQPSFLGTDNSYLLSALEAAPDRLRGIAVVDAGLGLDDLCRFERAGIVGVRLNLIGKPDPDLSDPVWRNHLAGLADLGWQVEIQSEAGRLPGLLPPLLASGVNVVIDHFSRPDPAFGVSDPGFEALLKVADSGKVWVKLSGAYRLSRGEVGAALAGQAAGRLLAAFGSERLVWGSDWPHTQFESAVTPALALAALHQWVPDPRDRDRILWDTAAGLFRFDTAVRGSAAC